jgi:hypothetical protein
MSPVTFVNQGYDSERNRLTFSRKGMKICSLLLTCFGVVAFICGLARIFVYGSALKFIGTGIWAGVIMIITGAFGIVAQKMEKYCLIVTSMVMSIISALANVVLLGFASGSLDHDKRYDATYTRSAVALESIEIIFSIAAFVVSILLSVVCCRAVCCCTNEPSNQNQPHVFYAPQQANFPIATYAPQQANVPTATYPAGPQVAVINGGTMYSVGQSTMYRI